MQELTQWVSRLITGTANIHLTTGMAVPSMPSALGEITDSVATLARRTLWADAHLHGRRNGERGVYQAARIKFGGSSGLLRGTTVKAVICVDALQKS